MVIFYPDPLAVDNPQPGSRVGVHLHFRVRMQFSQLWNLPVFGMKKSPRPGPGRQNKGVLLRQLRGAYGAFRGLFIKGERIKTKLFEDRVVQIELTIGCIKTGISIFPQFPQFVFSVVERRIQGSGPFAQFPEGHSGVGQEPIQHLFHILPWETIRIKTPSHIQQDLLI